MRHFSITRLLKSKRGLETPVANLIIVVATVLLATVVVLFAVNVMAGQFQKEKVYVATSHIWYVDNTQSIAALGITNTGATDVVLTKITVNGLQCEWNGATNYIAYCKFNGSLPGDLPFVGQINSNTNTTINVAGQPYDFAPADEGLTIKSGGSIAFYIVLPNCISVNNLSQPVDTIITTTQAVYCTETLVQAE